MQSAFASRQSPAPAAKRLLTGRFALILLAQTLFGFGWSLYLLTPKYLATVLGADAVLIGRVSATGGLAAVISVPLVAIGLDRVGRRLFFQLGSACIVALSLTYLKVDRMGPLVYLAQALMGVAFVFAFNGAATLAVDLAPPDRVGQAIGMIGAVNTVMNAVATVTAESIADRYGWSSVFKLGVLAGAGALLMSLSMRDVAAHERSGHASREKPRAANGSRVPPWIPLLLATMLIGAAFTAVFTFHQPYALSLGKKELRGFFIGFTCSAVTSRVVFGSLGDRFGLRRVSGFAAALYSISALLMVHLDVELLWVYGAVFGIAHGVIYPTLNALVLGTMPHAWRGRAMSLYNGAFNAGSALSALGWGMIAVESGYPAVFAGATLAAFGAAAILFADADRVSKVWRRLSHLL